MKAYQDLLQIEASLKFAVGILHYVGKPPPGREVLLFQLLEPKKFTTL